MRRVWDDLLLLLLLLLMLLLVCTSSSFHTSGSTQLPVTHDDFNKGSKRFKTVCFSALCLTFPAQFNARNFEGGRS